MKPITKIIFSFSKMELLHLMLLLETISGHNISYNRYTRRHQMQLLIRTRINKYSGNQ
jgi:hypothetical protein